MTMTLNELKQELDNLGVHHDISYGTVWLELSGWSILSFDKDGLIGTNAPDDVTLRIPACNPKTAILKDVLPLVMRYLETPLTERKDDRVYIKVTAVRWGDDDDIFSLKRPKYVFVQDNGDIVLGERKESKFKKSDAEFLMRTKFTNAVYELIPAGDDN